MKEYDNAKRAEVARVTLLDPDNFQEIAGDLICNLAVTDGGKDQSAGDIRRWAFADQSTISRVASS